MENVIKLHPVHYFDLLVRVVRIEEDTPSFFGEVLVDCGPFTLNRSRYGEGHLVRVFKSGALGGGFICPSGEFFCVEQALRIYNNWFENDEPVNPVDLYLYGLRLAQEASVSDRRFKEVVLTHRQNGRAYAALVVNTRGKLYLVVNDGENPPTKRYVGNFDTIPHAVELYDNTVQMQYDYCTAFGYCGEEPAVWAPLWAEEFQGEEV